MTAKERKERPVYSGVLRYFPLALLEIARVSYVGNEQHNPGAPVHWDREKSTDEADALVRHLLQAGELDTDGLRHTAKAAWRALALLEKELEAASGEEYAVVRADLVPINHVAISHDLNGIGPASADIHDSKSGALPSRHASSPPPVAYKRRKAGMSPDVGSGDDALAGVNVGPHGAPSLSKPAHDELYALGQPCEGGCGWLTYPETHCRKCRAVVG